MSTATAPTWVFPALLGLGYIMGVLNLLFDDRVYTIIITILVIIGCRVIYPKNDASLGVNE